MGQDSMRQKLLSRVKFLQVSCILIFTLLLLFASSLVIPKNVYAVPSINFTNPSYDGQQISIDSGEDVTFKWQSVSGTSYYLVSVRNTDDNKLLVERDGASSSQYTLSNLYSGNYRLWVAAYDSTPNITAQSTIDFSVSINSSQATTDTTAPQLTISPNSGIVTAGSTITVSASDSSGINHIGYYWDSGTTTTPVYSSGASITVPDLTGSHTLHVYAKDNSSDYNFTGWKDITYIINSASSTDTTAPQLTISPNSGTVTAGSTITVNASDPSGINHIGYAWDNDNTTTPVYSSSASINVPDLTGSHILHVYAKDNSTNYNFTGWKDITYTINNSSSTAGTQGSFYILCDKTEFTGDPVTLTSDAPSNFDHVYYYLIDNGTGKEYGIGVSPKSESNNKWKFEFDPYKFYNGHYYTMAISASDAAGNVFYGKSIPNVVINTPELTIVQPENLNALKGSITLKSLAKPDVDHVYYYLSSSEDKEHKIDIVYNSANQFATTFDTTTVANGTYQLMASCAYGNNTTQASNQFTITINNPATLNFSIDNPIYKDCNPKITPDLSFSAGPISNYDLEIYIDGIGKGKNQLVWNVSGTSPGDHTVTLVATDKRNGNKISPQPKSITVHELPTVKFAVAPALIYEGDRVTITPDLQLGQGDDPINYYTELYVDDQKITSGKGNAQLVWNNCTLGKHQVKLNAIHSMGVRSFSSDPMTVNVVAKIIIPTPVFNPPSGTYSGNLVVCIGGTTLAASIYYTTDGSEPSTSSLLYKDPFTIDSSTTIKAKAFYEKYSSQTAVAEYNFKNNGNAIIFIPGYAGTKLCIPDNIAPFKWGNTFYNPGQIVWQPFEPTLISDLRLLIMGEDIMVPNLNGEMVKLELEPMRSVQAIANIRMKPTESGPGDTYENSLTNLINNPNVKSQYQWIEFAGYDWRDDLEKAVDYLNSRIEKYDKVTIITHSTGGLIAAKYVKEYGSNKIDELVTIAAPFLGTPKPYYSMETGKFFGFGLFPDIKDVLIQSEVKEILPTFPSAYQLLSTDQYVSSMDTYIKTYDPLSFNNNPDNTNKYKGDELKNFITKRVANGELYTKYRAFHYDLFNGPKATDHILSGMKNHYNIIGVNQDQTKSLLFEIGMGGPKSYKLKKLQLTDGDTTVPVASADIKNGLNTFYVYADTYGKQLEGKSLHGEIINLSEVNDLVFSIIKGTPKWDTSHILTKYENRRGDRQDTTIQENL